ncbi:MAG: diadenylate cyclase [Proteobacteria bacterium]|nr:diadenylate cyclase [Pseudomonadota bacterium]
MTREKAERESLVLINEAVSIAEKLKIKRILIVCEKPVLLRAIPPYSEKCQFLVAISNEKLAEGIYHETILCDFRGVGRSDRLDYILRTALERGNLKKGEKVMCLYSLSGTKLIDSLRVFKSEAHSSHISLHDLKRIGKDIPVDVLYALVNLAVEIGREGREGVSVGTIFVVGDTERVDELSKSMIFDPFLGYPEGERSIFDPRVQESIKQLTLIDGAFIIREDGVVMSAGRYLHAGAGKATLFKGLGARHAAAAAITAYTNAVAITVSESTGTVRTFSGGKTMMSIRTYRPHLLVKRT